MQPWGFEPLRPVLGARVLFEASSTCSVKRGFCTAKAAPFIPTQQWFIPTQQCRGLGIAHVGFCCCSERLLWKSFDACLFKE